MTFLTCHFYAAELTNFNGGVIDAEPYEDNLFEFLSNEETEE